MAFRAKLGDEVSWSIGKGEKTYSDGRPMLVLVRWGVWSLAVRVVGASQHRSVTFAPQAVLGTPDVVIFVDEWLEYSTL